MALLDTVDNYIAEARVLLQDTATVKRYLDTELKTSLGLALLEARRLRPDLFPDGFVQDITSAAGGATSVMINQQYRMALVYYMAGHALLRDEEEGVQQIARAYKQQFGAQLVSISV